MGEERTGAKGNARRGRAVEVIVPWVLTALALVALGGAVLRMTAPEAGRLDRLDSTTLMYLGVAGALLLLRHVKSLAFGDYKVEFRELREIAEEALDSARIAEDAAMYGVGRTARDEGSKDVAESAVVEPGSYPDDPWKGQFGGASEANDRRLSANVEPLAGRPDWFIVHLAVESASPKRKPLRGKVQFFLHDTFSNDRPTVPAGPDGRAELRLKAWGAFTVGALADGGTTRLEIDLAELPDAPMSFTTR